MNWSKKTWEDEDNNYSPKRKVNNKLSWKIHHIIGSFHSNKMQRTVEYESLGECILYFFLEPDQSVVRYYVQPVEVNFSYLSKEGDKKKWVHVPDVLVFRNCSRPLLYQIKESLDLSEKHLLVNNRCIKFAEKRDWIYDVIYPKQLPKTILRNIKYLQGAIRKRKGYEEWIPEVLKRLRYCERITIVELAKSFSSKVSPLFILPVIYHLIAKGIITTNMYQEINEFSEIGIGSILKQLTNFVSEEGEMIED